MGIRYLRSMQSFTIELLLNSMEVTNLFISNQIHVNTSILFSILQKKNLKIVMDFLNMQNKSIMLSYWDVTIPIY